MINAIFRFLLQNLISQRNEFVIEEVRDCTDSNIIDGYPGKEVVYGSDGSEVVTTLYNFENMKASITAATGIRNPTYCVTKPWFQNITEYIERVRQKSVSYNMSKKYKKSKQMHKCRF